MSGSAPWRRCSSSGCLWRVAQNAAKPSWPVLRSPSSHTGVSAGRGHGHAWTPSLVRLTPLQPMRFLQSDLLLYGARRRMPPRQVPAQSQRSGAGLSFSLSSTPACLPRSAICSPRSEHLELPGMRSAIPGSRPSRGFASIRPPTHILPSTRLSCSARGRLSQLPRAGRTQPAGRRHQRHCGGHAGPRTRPDVGAPGGRASRMDQFQLAIIERLKTEFGVDWVLVSISATRGPGLPLAQRHSFRLPSSLTIFPGSPFCAMRQFPRE